MGIGGGKLEGRTGHNQIYILGSQVRIPKES